MATATVIDLPKIPGHELKFVNPDAPIVSRSYLQTECTCGDFQAYATFRKDGTPGSRLARKWAGHIEAQSVPKDFSLVIGRIITARTIQTIRVVTISHPDFESWTYAWGRQWVVQNMVAGKSPKTTKTPYTKTIGLTTSKDLAIHAAHEYMLGAKDNADIEWEITPGNVEIVETNDLAQGCLDLLADADKITQSKNVADAVRWREKAEDVLSYLELIRLKDQSIREHLINVTKGTNEGSRQ